MLDLILKFRLTLDLAIGIFLYLEHLSLHKEIILEIKLILYASSKNSPNHHPILYMVVAHDGSLTYHPVRKYKTRIS